jgi:hypothetical protein
MLWVNNIVLISWKRKETPQSLIIISTDFLHMAYNYALSMFLFHFQDIFTFCSW